MADSADFTVFKVPPDLVVRYGNLPATVRELRGILAGAGTLFDRGGVAVRLSAAAAGALPVAHRMTANAVVMEAHLHCRPVKIDAEGKRQPVTLSERCAAMWLDAREWGLPPLAGITGAPVLADDGAIMTAAGYDPKLQLWCKLPPAFELPDHPTEADTRAALLKVRRRFATFSFKDSPMVQHDGVAMVDTSKPPAMAESCFLAGLMTAVCRPSLQTAPGMMVTAPEVTGAGAGKGLLVRATCAIAFGMQPAAFTAGHDRSELDKRLVAELIGAAAAVFLDNVNATSLRSDTLASVLTENPASVRVMGVSQMVPLNCTAFIALTGNGLTVSEDLARRFIGVDLDPQCEDPEARPFTPGFLLSVQRDRAKILAAVLTIWRWGRQAGCKAGLPLGSYEQWAAWCRDPLVALGCQDPVKRIRDAKTNDPKRRFIADLFAVWWQQHADKPLAASDLAAPVLAILNPLEKGRQYVAQRLVQLTGTRAAGYVLTAQDSAGKWTARTYGLKQTEGDDGIGHRTRRAESAPEPISRDPMLPMGPMPYGVEGRPTWQGEL